MNGLLLLWVTKCLFMLLCVENFALQREQPYGLESSWVCKCDFRTLFDVNLLKRFKTIYYWLNNTLVNDLCAQKEKRNKKFIRCMF